MKTTNADVRITKLNAIIAVSVMSSQKPVGVLMDSDECVRYKLERLLWIMKTTKAYMKKAGCEIREAVKNFCLTVDCSEWMQHADEIDGAANIALRSWIDELEKVLNQQGDTNNELSK